MIVKLRLLALTAALTLPLGALVRWGVEAHGEPGPVRAIEVPQNPTLTYLGLLVS